MVSIKQGFKFMTYLSAFSLLLAFGSGCSAYKEAVAGSEKTTPVPPVAAAPSFDKEKMESITNRAESAARLAQAAEKKAELAAQRAETAGSKAELAADRSEKAAVKAETAANKAEAIFEKKMKK
jgi:hypothetical protein